MLLELKRGIVCIYALFPDSQKKPSLHREWVRACQREFSNQGISAVVCSEHFSKDKLDRIGQNRCLRESAVPTLFDLPQHLFVSCIFRVQSKSHIQANSNRYGWDTDIQIYFSYLK